MQNGDHSSYDAIIIGAGISGLVCGCYLAKAGMKVLIAERHSRPGGYCTSFKRKGFTFDAAAHSFGGFRPGGIMNRVLRELDLLARMQILKFDPSDVIVSPDHRISFWTDIDRTIHELQVAFPHESRVRDFISFLMNPQPADFAALRRKTFKDLLDQYFTDDRLKAVLSLPVLGNGDLPPSLIAAFSAAKIYSEFILDGGYYPTGGMQVLPDALAERFRSYGGELLLSAPVERIATRTDTATGILLQGGRLAHAKYVISNADATQTFTELVGTASLGKEFLTKLSGMIPSLSIFVVYLGIDSSFASLPPPGTNLWFLPHYDIEALHRSASEMKDDQLADYYMVRVSPDNKTILGFVNTCFKDRQFWKTRKRDIVDTFINKIEATAIPELSRHILHSEAATPATMHRYTLNREGAAYGWSALSSQFADPDFRKPPFIKNLYLTGHWTTYAQGIPGVTYLGYDTAKNILSRAETGR